MKQIQEETSKHDNKKALDVTKRNFMKWNSMVFILFEYFDRPFHLKKMQRLSRDMYNKKVPLYYKTVYLIPDEMRVEKHFINMVRNMNPQTHQYRGEVVYNLTQVSIKVHRNEI